MKMPVTLVLLVGLDASLLETRNVVLHSAGYFVVSAFSVGEAVKHFLNGDFDLVLLDNSLPKRDRDRLTCLIRASGSHTPVVSIASEDSDNNPFANATIQSDPHRLMIGVRNVLIEAAKLQARSIPMLREPQELTTAQRKKQPISTGIFQYFEQNSKVTKARG
jgi:DNA-binding response OmpR family regulator